MRYYAHRRNSLAELRSTPVDHGVELDLRDDGRRIIVAHDPFSDGPDVDSYFRELGARPCILNLKCEGIEGAVLAAAARHGVTDFFLLDLSIPAATKLARQGETRLAIRYSEVEPIELALAWIGRARWVWIDCFTDWPGNPEAWARLSQHFSLCVVSPELQGHGRGAISSFADQARGRPFHAVCTKHADDWQARLGPLP